MPTPRPDLALHVIKQLRSGRTLDDLNKAIAEAVDRSREIGKASEITLKIKIKPDKGQNGQYFLSDQIIKKMPEYDRGQTILFGTPEGNLQREDPAQQRLDLREVKQETQTELKEAN
ncbi:hypothetical protein [uncultured Zhongshania sp.]|uniref:hypothetical protein n=1 Tax=uncultured Zhongshania sp. TaxID=1642288 RepID=UPI0030D94FCA|tara:strand:+ start:524 stop:874 length:351 start_codon:yes stop_codon:yes gene_type:complete